MKEFVTRVRRLVRSRRRIVAAVLAGVAVWAGLSALRPAPPERAVVVVTARDLDGGTTLATGDVVVREVAADALPARYVSDPGEVVGRPLTVPLPAGAMLLPSSVVTRDSLAAPGRTVLPITLSANAAALVEVGDRIDLIAADDEGASVVVAAAVRVVAVVTATDDGSPLSPRQSAGPLVLVEVPPGSVSTVASASTRGPMAFGLR